jgi:hypothetical protein
MERLDRELRREFGRFGSEGSVARLVEIWPEAVGEAVARNAWPGRVSRDGTLHVATSSSSWAFELAQLAPTIAARLAELAPEAAPKGLRFAPGPLPEPPLPDGELRPPPPPAPSPETVAEAARIAAPVADQELRSLLARAAAASLAKGSDGRAF